MSTPVPKKRPAPEGVGLPGVVSSDIVNWEGNYILDTNTFLIDITSRQTLALSDGQELNGVHGRSLFTHFEVQVRSRGDPGVPYRAD